MLLPSIQNLILLSEILDMPLDSLSKNSDKLPLPLIFGKPNTLFPLVSWLFFPTLFFISAILFLDIPTFLIDCFLLSLLYAVGFYDFRKYYAYFLMDSNGFTICDEKAFFPLFPLITILKGDFGKKKGTNHTIPNDSISRNFI